MLLYYVIAGITWAFAGLVKQKLTSTYAKWGDVRNSRNASGAQTARAVLDANGLRDVHLAPAPGELSDHYDPTRKVIRLSEPVYGVPSVAAMAIAAHESGHAIQDAVGYKPFRLRTSLVPLAQLGARFGLPAAMAGFFLDSPMLIQIGVLTYLGALLFQIAALPVEFDASKRALQQLESLGLTDAEDEEGARAMLRAAAMTYVAGVASSAGYIVFLALAGGRRLLGKGPPPPAAP